MTRSLGLMLLTACSSGAVRDDTASSASLGDVTGSSGNSNATAWSGGDATGSSTGDDSASSTTPMGTTSTSATTDDSVTSTSDTTGPGAQSCAEDESACNAWFLAPGAMEWEALTIGGPAALAPSGSVLAAFDIEASQVGFVITADEVVRVDLATRAWVSKVAFDALFDEVNVAVESAYSIPAYWANMPGAPESIALVGIDVAFIYEYDQGADAFEFDQAVTLGAEWNGPDAPPEGSVREMWLDVTNGQGWVDANISRACPDADGPVGPYIAVVTDEVQILDAGYCFAFFPPVDYAAFAPTGRPGAPPVERIGGIAYNETLGLVVFASE